MASARTLGIVAAGLTGVYFIGTRVNDFKTPGVRNIEKRHIAAGGAESHTPAQASPLGNEEQSAGRQVVQKGVGTKHFDEKFGESRPETSELGKKWNRTMHDNEQGRGSSSG